MSGMVVVGQSAGAPYVALLSAAVKQVPIKTALGVEHLPCTGKGKKVQHHQFANSDDGARPARV